MVLPPYGSASYGHGASTFTGHGCCVCAPWASRRSLNRGGGTKARSAVMAWASLLAAFCILFAGKGFCVEFVARNGNGNGVALVPGDLQRVGEIVSIRHPVRIRRGGAVTEEPGADAHEVETLHNGDWIYDGDWIEVGDKGHVEFVIGNQGRIRLGARTRFQLHAERVDSGNAGVSGRIVHGYLYQGVARARVRMNVVTPLRMRFHARFAHLTLAQGDMILQGGARRMEVCVRSGQAEFQYIIEDEDGSAGVPRSMSIQAQRKMKAILPVQSTALPLAKDAKDGCVPKAELEFTVDQVKEPEDVPLHRRPDLDGA